MTPPGPPTSGRSSTFRQLLSRRLHRKRNIVVGWSTNIRMEETARNHKTHTSPARPLECPAFWSIYVNTRDHPSLEF
ncbi:uncharacterized protein LOC143031331 isoform X2 [Oratosquilla oratoria]